ncbi:MAG: hypothetical protein ACQUYJ_13840 [Ferruginibacter sp.]
MKRIIGLLLLVTAASFCCAQYRVKKAQAFFTVSTPGMAMKDEKGNTINPAPAYERFIYIECRFNGKPKVDSVFYNGILLMSSVADKEETTAKVGVRADNGNPVNFIAKKGNKIWRIDLQPLNGNILKHEVVKKITIKGKLAKTTFSHTLTAETELTTPDRY